VARRAYVRDNRGRFATVGATARGGRLRTAAGNKRATETKEIAGGKLAGAIGKNRAAKPAAKPANKIANSPRQLTADQKIARDVMTDKRFRSDRQRVTEMVKRGVSKDSDFVGLVADVRSKQGGGTTARIKPGALTPKPAAPAGGKPAGTIGKSRSTKPSPSKPAAKPAAASKPEAATNKGRRLGGSDKKLEFQRLYHGTSKEAADSIRSGGFRASSDGFLGKGVYFSSDKRVAGYYKSVAEGKTGGGTVLSVRVPKNKVSTVNQDSFFVASKEAKAKAQSLARQGRVARLQAPDDVQKVVLATEKAANRGLVRSTSTIRRRRRKP
jgi:hypothetical protein